VHYSVLLNESIDLLNIKPNGIYVDATFGRGGHSKAILDRLDNNGKLISFDKDIEAINYANLAMKDKRFYIKHDSFMNIKDSLYEFNIEKLDGIILDLGVSSPQLDNPDRGFSFRYNAPLDMRMDNTKGEKCSTWLNSASISEISEVIAKYGEERYAKKIANNIIKHRQNYQIDTTFQLVKIITEVVPFNKESIHPATRTFQALRIKVNNELNDLESFLNTVPDFLNIGGRVVVISFHSLEDRIVKNKFNELSKPKILPKWVISNDERINYKIIAKKIKPTLQEINENIRSRSAIMRCLERIY
jgi:16S rRNA (cytosine1402-N4)-methyltransferase